MRHLAALEMFAYLLVPWVLDLPWSLLFQYCLIWFIRSPNVLVLRGRLAAAVNGTSPALARQPDRLVPPGLRPHPGHLLDVPAPGQNGRPAARAAIFEWNPRAKRFW
ncbi:hypothetical protein ABZ410_11920 [Streptomyces cinnamoneus]